MAIRSTVPALAGRLRLAALAQFAPVAVSAALVAPVALPSVASAQFPADGPVPRLAACIENRATPEEVAAANWLLAYEQLRVRAETRPLVSAGAEQRAERVVAAGRAIDRLALVCSEEFAAVRPTRAEGVVNLVVPVLARRAAKDVGPRGQQAIATLVEDIRARIAPATLAALVPAATPSTDPEPLARPAGGDSTMMIAETPSAPERDAEGRRVVPARFALAEGTEVPCPYPVVSRRLGEQGAVVVLLRVDEGGLVRDVRVEESSGSERLDAMAVACLRGMPFVPSRAGGEPVASWQRTRWTWKLED